MTPRARIVRLVATVAVATGLIGGVAAPVAVAGPGATATSSAATPAPGGNDIKPGMLMAYYGCIQAVDAHIAGLKGWTEIRLKAGDDLAASMAPLIGSTDPQDQATLQGYQASAREWQRQVIRQRDREIDRVARRIERLADQAASYAATPKVRHRIIARFSDIVDGVEVYPVPVLNALESGFKRLWGNDPAGWSSSAVRVRQKLAFQDDRLRESFGYLTHYLPDYPNVPPV